MEHGGKFIKKWLRRPLEKEVRRVLRAECSRPVIEEKVCVTPNLGLEIIRFLFHMGRDPRKGFECSPKQCHDKILDVLGQLARIFDMAEEGCINDSEVDLELLRGQYQRVIILLGNANTGILTERRQAVLMKISPNLGDMAGRESSKEAKGLLFGEGLVKSVGKNVETFTALDKAYINMRKVFNKGFFGRAIRGGLFTAEECKGPNITTNKKDMEENFRPRQVPFRPEAEVVVVEELEV
ncbi:hypothetical protein NDU88_003113 [Pleurodeles waltl]|uniref:Uncharacterized protein n=1 Tax=Pleurodeles waltl TaxID=8319 RepID=A0AAV7MUQ0_PLEWA|nr:hypothetical protein NDU88_003113 [Pleurodeles waltl]